MHLGIFGGTFDPIHHGHLILARAAAEELALDRVLFVPANTSPHKSHAQTAAPADRLAMVRLALAGEPHFEVSDMELRRPPPSFTVDTLRECKAVHPNDDLYLLLGADQAAQFHTWHQPNEIRRLARVVVLDRAGSILPSEWTIVRRLVDISATDIRTRAATGRSIRYLTPDAVCDYIAAQRLYCQP